MIQTPETNPDDSVIGQRFKAWCMYEHETTIYYCDSYDTRIGYWMTRHDCPDDHKADEDGKWRRNVSERAIGCTYHKIYV